MPNPVTALPLHPVEVTHVALGTTHTVAVSGEIDMASCSYLTHAIDAALRTPHETVVLDMSAVTFLDSSGVRAVVAANARARAHGVRFVVIASRPVNRILELSGLSRILNLLPAAA